ncbi:unnamed protein product [Chrysoparadoxa australica]
MLKDTLIKLGTSPSLQKAGVELNLMFAPTSARGKAQGILGSLGLEDRWQVVPMYGEGTGGGAEGSDLTAVLRIALEGASLATSGGVVFIGMDCPELSVVEVEAALRISEEGGAYICPAWDGGYTLLALPSSTPGEVFEGVQWSHPHTCFSQMQAISRTGLSLYVSEVHHDIDEIEDVVDLEARLSQAAEGDGTCSCPFTLHAARRVLLATEEAEQSIQDQQQRLQLQEKDGQRRRLGRLLCWGLMVTVGLTLGRARGR